MLNSAVENPNAGGLFLAMAPGLTRVAYWFRTGLTLDCFVRACARTGLVYCAAHWFCGASCFEEDALTSCLLRIQTRHDVYLRSPCGGAIGAALRYAVSITLLFPYGTLAVNIIGSFLMGAAFVVLTAKGADRMMVFAMTGILGAVSYTHLTLPTKRIV